MIFKLTFHFQIAFAGEIIALTDDAGVAAAVTSLGIFDNDSEQVIIVDETELLAFVAFLD